LLTCTPEGKDTPTHPPGDGQATESHGQLLLRQASAGWGLIPPPPSPAFNLAEAPTFRGAHMGDTGTPKHMPPSPNMTTPGGRQPGPSQAPQQQ
jgi:hypothetical protein